MERDVLGAMAVAAGITLVAHAASLGDPLVVDDYVWIDPARRLSQVLDPTLGWFTPLTNLWWWGLREVVGYAPWAQRLAFALGWAGLAAWVMVLGRRVGGSALGGVVAGVVAAGHPAAGRAYHWVANWGHLLVALALVGALWAWTGPREGRGRVAAVAGWVLLGFLAKESALVLVLVVPALGVALTPERPWQRPTAALLVLGGVLAAARWSLRAVPGYGFNVDGLGAPGLHEGLPGAVASALQQLVATPSTLALGLLLGLGALGSLRRTGLALAGVVLAVLPFASRPGFEPAWIDGPAGRYYALPAVALALALVVAWRETPPPIPGGRRFVLPLGLVAVVACGLATWRAAAWFAPDVGAVRAVLDPWDEAMADGRCLSGAACTLEAPENQDDLARWWLARQASRGQDVSGWRIAARP